MLPPGVLSNRKPQSCAHKEYPRKKAVHICFWVLLIKYLSFWKTQESDHRCHILCRIGNHLLCEALNKHIINRPHKASTNSLELCNTLRLYRICSCRYFCLYSPCLEIIPNVFFWMFSLNPPEICIVQLGISLTFLCAFITGSISEQRTYQYMH